MRTTHERVVKTAVAESAISAKTIIVWGTAEEQVKAPGGADAGAIAGVAMHDAAIGEIIEFVTAGVAEVKVNAASPNIAKGDPIAIHGTTGRGKKSDLTNVKHLLGYANEAATADGVDISVELSKFSTPSA